MDADRLALLESQWGDETSYYDIEERSAVCVIQELLDIVISLMAEVDSLTADIDILTTPNTDREEQHELRDNDRVRRINRNPRVP